MHSAERTKIYVGFLVILHRWLLSSSYPSGQGRRHLPINLSNLSLVYLDLSDFPPLM